MSNKNLRIPTRDSEFNIYQEEVRNYLNADSVQSAAAQKGSPGGNPDGNSSVALLPLFNWERLRITPEEMENINFLGRDWENFYPLTKERHTRTPAVVEEKNSIKTEFDYFIRPVLGRIEKSPIITSTDRNALHLPKRDTVATRRPKITDTPAVKIFSLAGGLLKFRVRVNNDAIRASMNPLADAVELRYKIGGTPPKSVEECASSEMNKKSIFFLKTGIVTTGRKIWCYLRWVNLSSPEQTGPFGSLAQAVIQ